MRFLIFALSLLTSLGATAQISGNESLFRDGIRLDGAATDVRFGIGMSLDGGSSYTDSATAADNVAIISAILPDDSAIGDVVDVYFIDRHNNNLTMYLTNNSTVSWNGKVKDLQPFRTNVTLEDAIEITLFNGVLAEGDHRIFMGYKKPEAGKGELHFSPVATRLTITEAVDPFNEDEQLFDGEIGLLTLEDMGDSPAVIEGEDSYFDSQLKLSYPYLFSLMSTGTSSQIAVFDFREFENVIYSHIIYNTGVTIGSDYEDYTDMEFLAEIPGFWFTYTNEFGETVYANFDFDSTPDAESFSLSRIIDGYLGSNHPDFENEAQPLPGRFLGTFNTDFFKGFVAGPFIGTDDETAFYVFEYGNGTVAEKVGEIRQKGEGGADYPVSGAGIVGISNGDGIRTWKQINDELAVLVGGDGIVHFIDMSNPEDPEITQQIDPEISGSINDVLFFFNQRSVFPEIFEGVLITTDNATYHVPISGPVDASHEILIEQGGQYLNVVYDGTGWGEMALYISDNDAFGKIYRYSYDYLESSYYGWRKTHESDSFFFNGPRQIFNDTMFIQDDETENRYVGRRIILE